MSRKNFKVETADTGQTTKSTDKHPFVLTEEAKKAFEKKTKIPTGKVKTKEERERLKEARELTYRNFRIKALIRRGIRQKMSEEDIKAAVEKLKSQMDSPKKYMILLLYGGMTKPTTDKKSVPVKNLVEQAILNNKLKWAVKSDNHMYIEGDKTVLDTLRSIMPPGVKIYPYAKKEQPIIPAIKPPEKTSNKRRTKAEKKALAAAAKKARKQAKAHVFEIRKKRMQKQHAKFKYRILKMKERSKMKQAA